MGNISILDCTLRDGLRIIECEFEDNKIKGLASGLADSGIDIIEMGFLRDRRKLNYQGNSTFFTEASQITPFLPANRGKKLFTAFVDYGMFDFDSLEERKDGYIDGIRVGFTKKNYEESFDDVIRCMKIVQEKGYKLLMQGVNSLGYTDSEYLQLIKVANELKPYAFAVVDTYGAMYDEDLTHYFSLIDYNLKDEIQLDFHSHNNYQLSFSLAQKLISIAGRRNIIIDCTLNGVGKVAGNLNTELIINYLNRKYGFDYDEDLILDLIDTYTYSLKQEHNWGYSIPAFLAGEFKSHPNNIIYLTEKFRLDTKDIKYILSMIDEKKRQRYDYDNIERLYIEYNSSKVDDIYSVEKLMDLFSENKCVLLLGPGSTIATYKDRINSFIAKYHPIVITINYVSDDYVADFAFFGSNKRYEEATNKRVNTNTRIIVTSNIKDSDGDNYVINYSKVIEVGYRHFDNSTIMLLNLLKRLNVSKVFIAGVDGFVKGGANYYDSHLDYRRDTEKYIDLNRETEMMLRQFKLKTANKMDIRFITPSAYEHVFEKFVF